MDTKHRFDGPKTLTDSEYIGECTVRSTPKGKHLAKTPDTDKKRKGTQGGRPGMGKRGKGKGKKGGGKYE